MSEVVWSTAKSRVNEVHITEGLAPGSSEVRHTAKVSEVGHAAADVGEAGLVTGQHSAKIRTAWCRVFVVQPKKDTWFTAGDEASVHVAEVPDTWHLANARVDKDCQARLGAAPECKPPLSVSAQQRKQPKGM